MHTDQAVPIKPHRHYWLTPKVAGLCSRCRAGAAIAVRPPDHETICADCVPETGLVAVYEIEPANEKGESRFRLVGLTDDPAAGMQVTLN